jgi:diguanylate cyclase (GGDEF)-like protein
MSFRPLDLRSGLGRRSLALGLLAATLGLWLLAPGPSAAQRLNVQHYTSLEGIPQRQVLSLLQRSDGYIWLGTYGGLSRYNGAEFLTFTSAHGLSDNSVQDLAEDHQGRLLIATLGGGLCFLDGEEIACLRAPERLADDSVVHLLVDVSGAIWAATERGLTRLEGPKSRHFGTADGLPSENCRRVARDHQGNLWVGTRRGLARLDGDAFVQVGQETLGELAITLLHPSATGLWVGTEEGLFRLRGEELEEVAIPRDFDGATFADAQYDSDGILWLATDRGALRWDGETFEPLTEHQGLLSDTLYRVMVDREGNVWFAGEAGLSKLVPGPIVSYGTAEGLPHPFVRAIGEDALGRIWLGTRHGAAIYQDGDIRVAIPGDTLADGRIYSFGPLLDGAMLVGSRGGLVLYRDGVQRIFDESDGLPTPYVASMAPDPPRGMWLATDRGLAHWEEGRITTFPDHRLLDREYALALARGGDGRLWMGLASGGVAIFDGQTVEKLDASVGLTDQTVWSLAPDPGGGMWVASNGDGAFLVEDQGIRRFTTRDGLINDFVWQVLVDSAGDVWMYTNRGLNRYDGRHFHLYDQSDGLADLEGSAGAALEDRRGDLWFGSAMGVARYFRGRSQPPRLPPPVVIEEVYVPEHGLLRPGDPVPYGTGLITAHFAALSFRDEKAVLFRYRLMGASEEWSEPTAERRIGFARLEPGEYRLEVQASLEPGRWSEPPASFELTVEPAFWQTWAFRLAAVGALLGALVAGSSLRSRKHLAERRRLESMVAARTQELREKNELLAELASRDDLTQLHNRRRFLEQLEIELRKLSRSPNPSPLSLLLLDLDHFKEVNDRQGHLVGDQLLKAVADRVQDGVRSTDFVARYGGEELAVVMPGTDPAGARVVAEKIRAAVALPFSSAEEQISITASIGLATIHQLRRYEEEALLALIRAADAALYRAKEEGRDRVAVAEGLRAASQIATP